MALFNRPPSSSSLKSEKSAANTKKNVRFSDQSPDESLESHEPSVKSEPCGSHVTPETPDSRDMESASSIAELESPVTDVFDEDQRFFPSPSLLDDIDEESLADSFAASDKTLASQERKRDQRIGRRKEPLTLCSGSTEERSPTSERIISRRRTVRSSIGISAIPPPRFVNPMKITKPKNEERCIASYLNQHQLYILRQKETRIVSKLEIKSIPELQILQHKAWTCHASNKIKNLIQTALFEKHMAEMEEWESLLDGSSHNYQNKEKTRNEKQDTKELRELQELQEVIQQKSMRETLEITQETPEQSG
ncbi:hypothetical protein KCU71_g5032, partial [Aureobasidium melanogenum]